MMKFSYYTAKNIEHVLDDLKTSKSGLTEKEAMVRQKIYGFNEVKLRSSTVLDVLFRQFGSPLFYLLFLAAIVAFLIGEKIDGLAMTAFILVNVTLGFLQEYRAEKAISLLKRYLPSRVRVLRESKEKSVDKKFLVPGDIILVENGDIIPADLRILKLENFLVDESVLTGESSPVVKDTEPTKVEIKEIFYAKNILFSGTSVVSGRAEGAVVATAKETALGEVTKMISGIKRESSYEKSLLYITKFVMKIVILTIALIFLANLLLKGTSSFSGLLLFYIALIVSILPEALPAIVTFALSQGALKMAKEKVVVRRLSAVEDLGNIEILCVDKTGTLTKNKLVLRDINSSDKERCLLYGLLSSSYVKEKIESGLNPFDAAIYKKSPPKLKKEIEKFKVIAESPFDILKLRNSSLVEDEKGQRFLIVKGAPEIILKLSSNFKEFGSREKIEEEISRDGSEGKRILAVGFKKFNKDYYYPEDEKNLKFAGYFSFEDPLKETAKTAMKLSERLGIQVKLITGDTKEIAGYIGKKIGLIQDPQKVILGKDLNELGEKEFDNACEKFSVFARISPQLKYEIVKSLQKKYQVGFMGEGVNDAPAIKLANVGIVVKEAAEVSRQVSDIVLLEKDLKVVVNGIKNGRVIFSNINKYIKCALASNFGNFYSIAIISLFIPFLPMLPVQILLGNLLSDFPLISIATDTVDVQELRKPKFYALQKTIPLVIFLALVSTIFDFIFFGIFFKSPAPVIQTLWYIESILTEILLIFIIRTRHLFFKAKRPNLPLLFFTILDAILIVWLPFSAFGQEFFHFIKPPLSGLFIVFGLLIGYFICSEIVKLTYFRFSKRSKENNLTCPR